MIGDTLQNHLEMNLALESTGLQSDNVIIERIIGHR